MKFKKCASVISHHLGITSCVKNIGIKNPSVLMYHKVDRTLFDKQIKYLVKKYNIISLKKLKEYISEQKALPRNSVLITFDDGYKNNFVHAFPVLKKYNVPAVIFLTTGLVEKEEFSWYDKVYYLAENNPKKILFLGASFDLSKNSSIEQLLTVLKEFPNEKKEHVIELLCEQLQCNFPKKIPEEYSFLTWSEIKNMNSLVTFGVHTENHPILTKISEKDVINEITISARKVKPYSNGVLSFAYPNGDYNQNVVREVKNANIELAFTTKIGRINKNSQKLLLPRIPINYKDDYKIVDFKLCFYEMLYGKRR